MPPTNTDAVGSKIRRWAGWGSAISTGIVAVVAPLWVFAIDIRKDIQDTKTGTEASYETLAPIVAENQKVLYEGIPGLGSKVQDLGQSNARVRDRLSVLEQRVVRCETYIEVMSRGRYKPSREPLKATEEDAVVAVEPPGVSDAVQQVLQTPQRPVPESLRKAKAYQKKREKLDCSSDDPLCGL